MTSRDAQSSSSPSSPARLARSAGVALLLLAASVTAPALLSATPAAAQLRPMPTPGGRNSNPAPRHRPRAATAAAAAATAPDARGGFVQNGNAMLTQAQSNHAVAQAIGHHSFTPPLLRSYYGDGELPHWQLTGATVITDNYVRLTPDESSRVGQMWNVEPLDMEAFEITIGFRVHRTIAGGMADGFALWIVSDPPRTDGPLFGHPMKFTGAGIMFDTYDNDRRKDNPMVSLLYNKEGDVSRVYHPEKDFMSENKGACVFDYRAINRPRFASARIRYDKDTMQVFVSSDREDAEKLCFTAANVHLDVGRNKHFLGLTAQTGGVFANHDLIFIHVTPLEGYDYGERDMHATQMPAGTEAKGGAFKTYEGTANAPPPQAQPAAPAPDQKASPPPSPPPQQQQPPPPPPPPQPPAQQQQQQQQQTPPPPPPQQQQQPPPPPPPPQPPAQQQQQQQPPSSDDKAAIAALKKELEALRRGAARRPAGGGGRYAADDADDDDDGDVDDYEYDNNGRGAPRRPRRARVNRRRDY